MTQPTATLIKRFALAAAATISLAVSLLPGATHAAGTQSFQISPPTANYAADPGGKVTGVIKVTNLTAEPIALRVGRQNFVAKGEEGEIELVDDANPLYSLSPWFSVPSGTIDIPGQATKSVSYTVAIPADAEPGGRYGSITFSSIPPKLPSGQSGAAVQQTIAAIVFQRINGAATEQLEVASFAADPTFSEYGPVKLVTRVKNTGNVHEKPIGTITIKNMFGMTVDKIALDEHFVIPGAVRRLTNTWPAKNHKPFLIGRYTAELNATYGSDKKLTAATTFTVLPWKLLAVILIVLIILFLIFFKGRKRLARAGRILTGRE
jgi:hypothetical protein